MQVKRAVRVGQLKPNCRPNASWVGAVGWEPLGVEQLTVAIMRALGGTAAATRSARETSVRR